MTKDRWNIESQVVDVVALVFCGCYSNSSFGSSVGETLIFNLNPSFLVIYRLG
jgi:hypothetical protein